MSVNERYGGPNGFLLKMVEQELTTAGFSSSDIQGGGLRVTTTFHEDDQEAAIKAAEDTSEQAANASGEKESGLHAAVASVDVSSGEVLALYGGPDYVENSRNWATTARPTASTFKAFTLAAGFKQRNHDQPDPIVNVAQSEVDNEIDIQGTLSVPLQQGWSMDTTAGYRGVSSNYDLYNTTDFSGSIGFTKKF